MARRSKTEGTPLEVATDIQWELREFDVDELIEWDDNPRILSEKELEDLKESIKKFGLIDRCAVNQDMKIAGGHGRKTALKRLGIRRVKIWWPSRPLTEEEFRELNIRLNRNNGQWDWDKLAKNYAPETLVEWGFQDWEVGLKKKGKNHLEFIGDSNVHHEGQQYDNRDIETAHVRMLQLFYKPTQFEFVMEACEILGKEFGTDNPSDTIYQLLNNAISSNHPTT